MIEEFYHKDIFGTVVDVNLSSVAEEEKSISPAKSGRVFNIFTLTDAVGARQKKQSWIIYRQALASGISAEEIFYKVVWQIKSMLIALRTKSALETDMNTFPYNKAKGFLKNFKPGELETFSESLVIGYYRSRRGEGELETFIEKFLLSL